MFNVKNTIFCKEFILVSGLFSPHKFFLMFYLIAHRVHVGARSFLHITGGVIPFKIKAMWHESSPKWGSSCQRWDSEDASSALTATCGRCHMMSSAAPPTRPTVGAPV